MLRPKSRARWRQLYGQRRSGPDRGIAPQTPPLDPATHVNPQDDAQLPHTSQDDATSQPVAGHESIVVAESALQDAIRQAQGIVSDNETLFALMHEGLPWPALQGAKFQLREQVRAIREAQTSIAYSAGQVMTSSPREAEQMIELVRYLDLAFQAIVVKVQQVEYIQQSQLRRDITVV